jgi:hypothetical protein
MNHTPYGVRAIARSLDSQNQGVCGEIRPKNKKRKEKLWLWLETDVAGERYGGEARQSGVPGPNSWPNE